MPTCLKSILSLAITFSFAYTVRSQHGLKDVEIIEPGNHPVQFEQTSAPIPISNGLASRLRMPGQQAIYPLADLSPASLSAAHCPTHIHNFYYSGKSDFQCQIIAGGRTRIVTVHPDTGEPIEFFAMLAPGAPQVQYRKNYFAYVYPDHRTVIRFPSAGIGQPRVTVGQQNGPGLAKRLDDFRQNILGFRDKASQTNTAQSLKTAADAGKSELSGMGVLVDRGISGTIDTTKAITDLLPGKAYLQSLSEQKALDQRDNQIRDVQRDAKDDGRFIRWPN
jgi:hypothetical protein